MKRHLAILALALLAGCDMLGIESPEKLANARFIVVGDKGKVQLARSVLLINYMLNFK